MNKLFIAALAFSAIGLSACSSTDTAAMDQAPYAYERTVGAQQKAEPMVHSNTVFHARQGK